MSSFLNLSILVTPHENRKSSTLSYPCPPPAFSSMSIRTISISTTSRADMSASAIIVHFYNRVCSLPSMSTYMYISSHSWTPIVTQNTLTNPIQHLLPKPHTPHTNHEPINVVRRNSSSAGSNAIAFVSLR